MWLEIWEKEWLMIFPDMPPRGFKANGASLIINV